MSRNYDNWERLVAAVLRREQDWRTCHEQSITTSFRSSISSDFSYSASFSDAYFNFENPRDGLLLRSSQSLPFQTLAGIRKSKAIRPEKLVHLKGSPFAFGPQELLMAPSFALGEDVGTFTNTYAVSLIDGTMVVVKRLRRGYARYKVWEQRFLTIEAIEHENVVGLRGYFFNEDEYCFGFYDYTHQGILHTMLHGGKGKKGSMHLDWDGRIRIAVGAAKGLLHIHKQSGNFVHGSVKSSNIFVNAEAEYYGCIDVKPELAVSYYNKEWSCHPPEVHLTGKFTQASDVYSFGVVLIELLSGRSPSHFHDNKRRGTFAAWALHNARDEWTMMVFDRDLLKYSLVKQALSDMLQVALCCVKKKAEERPDMKHVVEMLQLIPTTFPVYSN